MQIGVGQVYELRLEGPDLAALDARALVFGLVWYQVAYLPIVVALYHFHTSTASPCRNGFSCAFSVQGLHTNTSTR